MGTAGQKEPRPRRLQWRLFENEVANFVKQLDSRAIVEHNAVVRGELSKTRRQVDVLIRAEVASHAVLGVAECKRYMTPVGIDKVDEFIGKLLDIGAHFGLMYAFAGYTRQAKARARGAAAPKVELRRLPEEEGRDYAALLKPIKFGDCPNRNCITGDVQWCEVDGEGLGAVQWGTCDTCGTSAVRCSECGSITGLDMDISTCEVCEAVYEVVRDRKGLEEGVRRVR